MSLSKHQDLHFDNDLDAEEQQIRRKYPLPSVKTRFPWKRNKLYGSPEVKQWMRQLFDVSLMSPEEFAKIQGTGLLSALFYPLCEEFESYEMLVKMVVLQYIFDDHTECDHGDIAKDGSIQLWQQFGEIFDSLERDSTAPESTWKPYVQEMWKTMRAMYEALDGPQRKRLLHEWRQYMDGNVEELEFIRLSQRFQNLEDMFKIRTKSSGVGPCLQAIEFAHRLFIPEQVWESARWQRLLYLSTKHIFVYNDMFSFEKEINEHGGNMDKMMFNTVAVISITEGVSIDEALEKTVLIIEETESEMWGLEEEIEKNCTSEDTKVFIQMLNLLCGGHVKAYDKMDRYSKFHN